MSSGDHETLLRLYVGTLVAFAFLVTLCLLCTWRVWSDPNNVRFARGLADLSAGGVKYVRTRVFASGVEVESDDDDAEGDGASDGSGSGAAVSGDFFAPLDAASV